MENKLIQAVLSYGEKDEDGNIVHGIISPPESNLGSFSTNLYKNGKYKGTIYDADYEECKSIAESYANPDEYEHIGYFFNGRFYKSEHDLRGKTMSDENQPKPLYIKKD